MKKLSESIWRNISQRSEGIKTRKEENINNFDLYELREYVESIYKSKVDRISICTHSYSDRSTEDNCLDIDVIQASMRDFEPSPLKFSYNPARGYVSLFHGLHIEITDRFFKDFEKKFKLDTEGFYIWITEKSGNCTNQTYINVLNLFFNDIQEYYKEI